MPTWIDKIHIVESSGFNKATSGNAWNGGTRTSQPIAISKEGEISTILDASKKYAFGFSKVYRKGNYTLFDFAFLIDSNVFSIKKGVTTNHNTVANGATLSIKKVKVGNEFYIQFFINGSKVNEYNAGFAWEIYYGELAMFTQGQSVNVITFTETALTPPTILTSAKTYTHFQNSIFKSLMPQYIKESDSYKDVNGRGFLQRFLETFGKYLDEYIVKYISEITDRVVSLKTLDEYLIPYWETQLGVNLKVSDSLTIRRKILENFITLSKVKGSKRGYTLAMKLLLFEGFIINNVDVLPDYLNPIPSQGCNACTPYDLNVSATLQIITPQIVDAIFNVASYNEPINWKLDEVNYNGNILTKDFVTFFFKDSNPFSLLDYGKDAVLYLDNSKNLSFTASINSLSRLVLNGSNEQFYEYDDKYFGNRARMIFRKPAANAYTFFDSLPPTNVTNNSFSANWNAKANATKYFLNVGRSRANDNEIIKERVVDNLELPNATTSLPIIDLLDDTPYYYQVIAENAQGQRALSSVGSVITKKSIGTPIALPPNAQSTNFFIATWQRVAGATAYELDISTDNTFATNTTTLQLRNINQQIIFRSAGTYYYRVRAKVDKAYRDLFYPKPISVSGNSNVVTVQIIGVANAWSSGFSNGFGI